MNNQENHPASRSGNGMEELNLGDDALFETLSKTKKQKKRKIIRTVLIIVLILAILLVAGVAVLQRQVRARFASNETEVLSETVTTGTINTTVSGSGVLTEVDLEQILVWNPEVIIFAPDSCYDAVADAPQWQSISAVASRNYYETPYGPYGWLSSPPAVQRYLGMLWLGKLLYPEYAEYDLQEEVTAYYKLFYGCDLTDEMYRGLMENAMPR